eukprot:scaffold72970_cov19-Tisochrysis_lutea.AAC.2
MLHIRLRCLTRIDVNAITHAYTCALYYAAAFAAQKLQKSGRCHESEIFKQFRRSYAKYRSEEAISDDVLRDM